MAGRPAANEKATLNINVATLQFPINRGGPATLLGGAALLPSWRLSQWEKGVRPDPGHLGHILCRFPFDGGRRLRSGGPRNLVGDAIGLTEEHAHEWIFHIGTCSQVGERQQYNVVTKATVRYPTQRMYEAVCMRTNQLAEEGQPRRVNSRLLSPAFAGNQTLPASA